MKDEELLAVYPRLDWTIAQMEYHVKAMAELQRRYEVFVEEKGWEKPATTKAKP